MKIKNKIQKMALATTILFASLPTYSLSGGGIAGVTIGAAAAVALTAGLVHRKHKREREENNQDISRTSKKRKYENSAFSTKSEFTQSKKSMKKDLKHYKSDLCMHKDKLRKSKRKDKKEAKRNNRPVTASPETMQHQSKIQELETMIENLERRIENAV